MGPGRHPGGLSGGHRGGHEQGIGIVGARPDVPKKPDPAAALAIARELGVAPEKFIYFGDTAIDMKTAASAGMFSVGVLWGFRGPEELLPAGARMLVKSPADLLAWLRGF